MGGNLGEISDPWAREEISIVDGVIWGEKEERERCNATCNHCHGDTDRLPMTKGRSGLAGTGGSSIRSQGRIKVEDYN